MRLPYFQIDSFTDRVFGGNPAGVCPLLSWPADDLLQAIAAENGLAETAFFMRRPSGEYDLRWFSPGMEVDLCGHATLAAAHVLWRHGVKGVICPEEKIVFQTRSGPLTVMRKDNDLMVLNFPARPAEPMEPPPDVLEALGSKPLSCAAARDYLFEFTSEEEVRLLRPDFARIAAWQTFAVIVTAPGRDVDFVSRFFAPRAGVPEDSATGSSHCTLVPFWAGRLGRSVLRSSQVSRREGQFFCELMGDRVEIGGHAVTFSQGEIEV